MVNNGAAHMSLKLTRAMVDTLRDAYAVVDRVDPTTPAYRGVCRLLDQMSQDDLKMLRDANIRWLSSLADERVKL
jgi:hypothetical protein